MRQLLFLFFALPITLLSQTPAERRYEILPAESKVLWHGEDISHRGGHDGTIQLSAGHLLVKGTQISKGDFTLDMTTIHNTDQKNVKGQKGQKDLEEHLKNADFFEVDKFPKAFFSITRANELHDPLKPNQYVITGFLSMKGITNIITFPATVSFTKNTAKAIAGITIDRTKWNVTFQSRTIFSTIKEGALSDEIKITLDLTFKTK